MNKLKKRPVLLRNIDREGFQEEEDEDQSGCQSDDSQEDFIFSGFQFSPKTSGQRLQEEFRHAKWTTERADVGVAS